MTDQETPTFSDAASEAAWLRRRVAELQDTLRDMEASLQDFTESSKEVEEAMDREIRDAEKRERDLQVRCETLKGDVDDWKSKYQAAISDHNRYHAKMDKEMASVKESQRIYREKLREMEVSNDELENAERMIASSLSDMEARYNKALERTALLEEELVAKARLEEENQRLKDELNEVNEELGVLRETAQLRSRAQSRADTPAEPSSSAGRSSVTDDLHISDLEPKRQAHSALDRPPSRTAAGSGSTLRQALTRTPGGVPGRRNSLASHARRGSRDVTRSGDTGGGSYAAASAGGDESPSLRASRTRRDLPSSSARPSLASRTPTRPVRSSGLAAPNSSMRMMQDMQARMRALEARITSARNVGSSKAAMAAADEMTQSSIPRPSSRLSSSVGPNGYQSPAASATPTGSRGGGGASVPRPSFDGKATIGSSIPVPPNGLSKSTSRRPDSRLSIATSQDAASPPAGANLPLRSLTPSGGAGASHGSLLRGPSPLEFLDHEPPPLRSSGIPLSASRRRSSITAGGGSSSSSGAAGAPSSSSSSSGGGGTTARTRGSSTASALTEARLNAVSSSSSQLPPSSSARFRTPARPSSLSSATSAHLAAGAGAKMVPSLCRSRLGGGDGGAGANGAERDYLPPPNAWRGLVSVGAGGGGTASRARSSSTSSSTR